MTGCGSIISAPLRLFESRAAADHVDDGCADGEQHDHNPGGQKLVGDPFHLMHSPAGRYAPKLHPSTEMNVNA